MKLLNRLLSWLQIYNCMRRKLILNVCAIALIAGMISCKKETGMVEDTAVSEEVIGQLRGMGFGTDNVQRVEEGYLVEGDMIVTEHMLAHPEAHGKLRVAEVEQYRTFNLVNTGGTTRTIRVGTSGSIPTALSVAIDSMINRYNALNLLLRFQRVTSSPNITIKVIRTNQYIASAGFPTSGNPYNTVNYSNRYISGYSNGFITTVLAHEVGHCIGFRHTDYMNRAFSCGTGGNEGQETTGVGAVHIPGTPTTPDAASWMLACAGATTNRQFNANDRIALNYLY